MPWQRGKAIHDSASVPTHGSLRGTAHGRVVEVASACQWGTECSPHTRLWQNRVMFEVKAAKTAWRRCLRPVTNQLQSTDHSAVGKGETQAHAPIGKTATSRLGQQTLPRKSSSKSQPGQVTSLLDQQ